MKKYLNNQQGVVVVGYALFVMFLAIASVVAGTAINHHRVAAEQHSLNQ